MRRIVLHGYYGNGNMGDDAILYVTEAILRRTPNAKLQVVGHPIPFMSTTLGKYTAKIPFTKRLLYKNHTRQMLEQIDKADALILGGGGIFCDSKHGDVTNDVRLIQRMQERHKPNMIYAIGVPSLWRETSKRLIRQVVENANYVSCRDPTSAKKIEALGAPSPYVTGDPAIKVPKVLGIHSKPKKLDLQMIHVCFSLRNDNINRLIVEALAKLATHLTSKYNAKISFIPMRTRWYGDDRVAHNLFRDKLEGGSLLFFDRRPSVKEFVKELTHTTLTIGMPLHSTLLSASLGVPCIAIAYTEDVASFMKYIQADDYSVLLKDACEGSFLIEKTEDMLNSYTATSRRILENIEKIEEKMLLDEKAIKRL